MTTVTRTGTRDAILVAATRTVQTDGYNALSFRDLAADTGIKSASVHYYFPTKGDLAEALISQFSEGLLGRMTALEAMPFEAAMDGYVALFRAAFDGGQRMCLVGMMSAEITALPARACQLLEEFASAHKAFLTSVLRKKHKTMAEDALGARAMAIFAAMEGAQLIAKGLGSEVAAFDEIVACYRASGLLG